MCCALLAASLALMYLDASSAGILLLVEEAQLALLLRPLQKSVAILLSTLLAAQVDLFAPRARRLVEEHGSNLRALQSQPSNRRCRLQSVALLQGACRFSSSSLLLYPGCKLRVNFTSFFPPSPTTLPGNWPKKREKQREKQNRVFFCSRRGGEGRR